MARVLIFDERPAVRATLASPLRRTGHDVQESGTLAEALALLRAAAFDVTFAGQAPRTMDGQPHRALAAIIDAAQATLVVAIGTASVPDAVQAIKAGAHDYLQLPADPHAMVRLLHDLLGESRRSEPGAARPRPPAHAGSGAAYGSDHFVAADGRTKQLFEWIRRVAEVDCTVLITGESGTGKEVAARGIFEQSRRRGGRFVPVNCGAIPDTLIESELFGYHKGAFTGASSDKPGLLEEADGGVLFLDEIGEMSPRFQATLLRFLDNSEVRRVGGTTLRRVNTRIIAATNRRLDQEVQRGLFRHDLFYRISVVPLHVAPLRERPDDVPALAEHFLRKLGTKFQMRVRGFAEETLDLLQQYHWPGNVRELQNVVEASLVLTRADVIEPEALPLAVRDPERVAGLAHAGSEGAVMAAIERFGGNRTQAAAALGVSRTTLWRRLRRGQGERETVVPRS